jgi:hypothetical protein
MNHPGRIGDIGEAIVVAVVVVGGVGLVAQQLAIRQVLDNVVAAAAADVVASVIGGRADLVMENDARGCGYG